MRDTDAASGQARQVTARVTGMGALRVGEVSIKRELPEGLSGFPISGGWTAATGSVDCWAGVDAAGRTDTPWTARWPRPGDRVNVNAVTDGVSHRVFTGQVDSAASSFADNGVSVSLVDYSDRLSRTISHEAVFSRMPPHSKTGDSPYRWAGMRSSWVYHLAARLAGFYMTPPRAGFTTLDVPLVGGTWPRVGQLYSSESTIDSLWPVPYNDDGSWATGDFKATYLLPNNPAWGGGITASRPLNVTMGCHTSMAASSHVTVVFGDSSFRLSITSGRSAVAQIIQGGTTRTVCSVLRGDWRFVTMRVARDAQSGWASVTLMTDRGDTSTGRTQVTEGRVWSSPWGRVDVHAPTGAPINGVLVDHDPTKYAAQNFRPTFRADGTQRLLNVIPHIDSKSAREILDEQSKAETAAVWIDEDGILRWADRHWLVSQPITQTLVSSQIADAEIELDTQSVRRAIEVKWLRWLSRVAQTARMICYEGSKDEFSTGDSVETIITPPSGEEWMGVDETLEEIWGSVGGGRFSAGLGSWHGWTALTSSGDEIPYAAGDGIHHHTFRKIGAAAWKWTFEIPRLPSRANRVRTATRSEGDSVKRVYQGMGLPLIRCMAIANSQEEVATVEEGPAWAGDLEHDGGWFFQSEAQATGVARRISSGLSTVTPTIKSFKILPDSRIQLGDKIRIVDSARTGVSLIGIVCAVDQAISAGSHTMSIDLLVVTISAGGMTLAQFDALASGMTLRQLDQALSGKTLTDWDRLPSVE